MIVIGIVIMFFGITGSFGSITNPSSYVIGEALFGIGLLITIIGGIWKYVTAE